MAPSISDLTINVFPNTAVFTGSYLSASGRSEDTFTSSDFSVSGDYLVYVISDIDIIGTTTITINGHTYTYETYDGKDTLTIYLGDLYAWTTSSDDSTPVTFYTNTENPTTDTTLYKANGEVLSFGEILYANTYNFDIITEATSSKLKLRCMVIG